MSRSNPGVIYDGFDDSDAGMDSGRSPHLLLANQSALLVNATTRWTRLTNRPGFTKIALNWDGEAAAQTAFETTGKLQHASAYVPRSGNPYLMAVVGGRVFTIKPLDGGLSKEITIAADPNATIIEKGYSTQAEMFWIYNDRQSKPFVWDDVEAFRTGPRQLRPGGATTYLLGRVWYATPDGFGFRAGDIAGLQAATDGEGGTAKYGYFDSLLKETENTYLNEGGDFLVPQSSGGICAMMALPNQDMSYGQGPLQVFTPSVTFSVQAPTDRTLWRQLSYPIQSVSITNYGALSQDACITVNGDLWFRAVDGLRSFMLARREFGTWGNTAQSREMDRILVYDQVDLLDHASAVVFENRILCTVSPYQTSHGVAHRGLMALNLDRISSIVDKPFPSYDGVWTHQPILQMVKLTLPLEDKLYMFSIDEDDHIAVYELSKSALNDDGEPITYRWDSRAFDFRQPYNAKELDGGELWVSDVRGTVNFTARFKQDGAECWTDWHSWSICANVGDCDDTTCEGLTPRSPQYRMRMGLPKPPYVTDTGAGVPKRLFNEIQVRVDVEGHCSIDRLLLAAKTVQEDSYAPLNVPSDCKLVTCCPEGVFDA